jgi:hypothetical protein
MGSTAQRPWAALAAAATISALGTQVSSGLSPQLAFVAMVLALAGFFTWGAARVRSGGSRPVWQAYLTGGALCLWLAWAVDDTASRHGFVALGLLELVIGLVVLGIRARRRDAGPAPRATG